MQKAHGSLGNHATVPPKDIVLRPGPYSYPPAPHDWARIKGAIHEYYVVQNQPLHSVRELLREVHGFRASERMIKARLSKWEYIKNAKREDWGYLAILHDTRKKENKSTVFEIRGHRKTVKDLQRFIRNQNISPEKFLAESQTTFHAKGQQIPDYIRALTPDLNENIYSPSADTSLTEVRSPSPATPESAKAHEPNTVFLSNAAGSTSDASEEYLCYSDPAKSNRDNFEHECPYQSYATEVNRLSPIKTTTSTMSSPQSKSRQGSDNLELYYSEQTRRELEACSTQLLKPVPLIHRIGHNDMRCWSIISPPVRADHVMEVDVCVRCDQSSSFHFPSLDLFEPRQGQRNILNDTAIQNLHLPASTQEEGSWVWVSLCFLTCMSLRRNDEEVATQVLEDAAQKFEKLLRVRDKMLLTAAGLVITILHMHDQEKISTRILDHANAVAQRTLPHDDPVRITIQYLALSADSSGERFKNAGFTSAQLKPVYDRLRSQHSAKHPYVIAAHFNYAWMLKHDGKIQEAEKHARQVHRESTECFGRLHMQTITSLSVIAGCLALQTGKAKECIETYRTMIKDVSQILGVIHPFTLEAQRRLADKLQHFPGHMNMVLRLHRTILFGRATMLGRDHKFTTGQKQDYERLLRKLNRWVDEQGNPSKERREIDDLFMKDPEEGWELVDKVGDCVHPPATSVEHPLEEEWCRLAIAESMSRSTTPGSGNEYEAY